MRKRKSKKLIANEAKKRRKKVEKPEGEGGLTATSCPFHKRKRGHEGGINGGAPKRVQENLGEKKGGQKIAVIVERKEKKGNQEVGMMMIMHKKRRRARVGRSPRWEERAGGGGDEP